MAEVDHPRFDSVNPVGTVQCSDCPFTDEDGCNEPGTPLHALCTNWGATNKPCCPTAENYAEACALAAEAVKG